MKKKAIEQIPFLKPTKVDKQYSHVAAAELVEIQGEETLILDIFENKKRAFKTPLYRFAYTKKTWGQYAPADGKWTHKKIRLHNRVNWQQTIKYHDLKKTFLADQQIELLEEFTTNKNWKKEQWWQCLDSLENKINWDKQRRSGELRQGRLEERKSHIEELPKEFDTWVSEELFRDINFIYYKRKGRYATLTCSHCGQTYTYATEQKETYEGQFEHIVRVPKKGEKARCEVCDAVGTYKPVGHAKDVQGFARDCYVAQPYHETGAIIRCFRIEKLMYVGEKERIKISEIERNYYETGKKIIVEYQLWNGWSCENEWCDHNIGGLGSQIIPGEGVFYPPSIEKLKGTLLQYSGIMDYMKRYNTIKIIEYMNCYLRYPCIEMFAKTGLHHLVNDTITYQYNTKMKVPTANTPQEILGIHKNKLKFLIKNCGEIKLLEVLQLEKTMGMNWTEEQCVALKIIAPNFDNLAIALKYMTLQQFLNRVEKYVGATIDESICGHAVSVLKHTTTTYLDYLDMREKENFDLHNSIYAYPKDLEEEHQKMVNQRNKEQIEKREKEVTEKYNDIKSNYRKLRKIYYYEDENYCIRPARDATEIVTEGRTLHHCVGGNKYLRKHNDGENYILFLRNKNEPDKPYITVEIKSRYNQIVQWYGAYDKKTDEAIISKWLDAYTTRLTCIATETIAQERIMIVAG